MGTTLSALSVLSMCGSSQPHYEQVHCYSQFTDWKLRLKGQEAPLKIYTSNVKIQVQALVSRTHALHCYTDRVKPDRNPSLVALVTEAKQLLPKVNSKTTRYPWAPPILPCVCESTGIVMGWYPYDLSSCHNNL